MPCTRELLSFTFFLSYLPIRFDRLIVSFLVFYRTTVGPAKFDRELRRPVHRVSLLERAAHARRQDGYDLQGGLRRL